MRVIFSAWCVWLMSIGVANGQSLELFGSAGLTTLDPGNSVAAGAGFSPHRRLTLVFSFDRTHTDTQISQFPGGFAAERGGTLYLGAAELRVLPFGRDRVGPYGLSGLAAGLSRPNVNQYFPERVNHGAAVMFLGGGLHVPFGGRFTAFADWRLMFGGEGREGVVAVAPLRAGVSWRLGS